MLQYSHTLISMLTPLLVSIRPSEWVKNTFLFAALLFSKNLLNLDLLPRALMAFGLYCLAAGAVYLINDIWDREEDRRHPQKCLRPIAAGSLPITLAAPVAILMLLCALGGAFHLGLSLGIVTAAYVLLSIAYSKWIKHMVILDVFSIAGGFVLRVMAGAVAINVVMSHWLLICTLLLALFLGFSKRRIELVVLEKDAPLHRRVLAEYNPLFLDMMIAIVTSATIVGYALYTVSDETIEKFHTDRLLLTVPFVLYGIFRYLYLVYHQHHGGNPAQTLLADGPLLINITLWAIASGVIIYTASV